jgi:hypothetical protein
MGQEFKKGLLFFILTNRATVLAIIPGCFPCFLCVCMSLNFIFAIFYFCWYFLRDCKVSWIDIEPAKKRNIVEATPYLQKRILS